MGDGFLSIFKTRAIIIKSQDYKEYDKLVWLYTEKLGKISALAKGAKKGNSRLMASTLSFCYGDYVLFKGKSIYTINEASMINSFQSLMTDLESITYGSYINELVDISTVDEESNHELFKALVTTYYFIENRVSDIELLTRTFEVKLLQLTGYGLDLDNCCRCKTKLKKSNYIDLNVLGAVCSKCEKTSGIGISDSTYNILKYLVKIPLEKVYRISLNEENKSELYKLLYSIISEVYAKKPKSLDMLKYIKKE